MNLTMTLDEHELNQIIDQKVESAQPHIQQAMGEMFKDIVMSNFGPTGIDRPAPWPPLSDRSAIGRAYIRKVGRSFATLYETGAMAGAVRETDMPDVSSVSLSDTDCPYATRHHEGGGNLPRRRVFPILDDGNITDRSKAMVMDAAQIAATEVFHG